MKIKKSDLDTSMTVIDGVLIVSLNSDIEDNTLENLVGLVSKRAAKNHVRAVILDFSMVRVISSFTFGKFESLSKSVALMGGDSVWVGLKPGVVISLIDLGLADGMKRIKTGLNIEEGLKLISGGSN